MLGGSASFVKGIHEAEGVEEIMSVVAGAIGGGVAGVKEVNKGEEVKEVEGAGPVEIRVAAVASGRARLWKRSSGSGDRAR
jgi:hypothetical protein